MCGIVAVIAPKMNSQWRHALLSRLLAESQSRGRDATGVAFVGDKGLEVLKRPEEAEEFIQSDEFLALENRLPPIVIGHCRGASRTYQQNDEKSPGHPKNNNNNHPFLSKESGIALVHNGVISKADAWRETAGKEGGLKYPCTGTTDSEVALRLIETLYLADGGDFMGAIDQACWNMAGSYNFLIVKETDPDKLWMVRKGANDVAIAYLYNEKAIVIASTRSILEDALKQDRILYQFFVDTDSPKKVINQLTDDQLVELTMTELKPRFRQKKITPAPEDMKFHRAAAEAAEKEKSTTEAIAGVVN